PLVDEAQLWPVVGETDPYVQVSLVCRFGGYDEELAAHAEMRDERIVGTPVGLEWQPEVLATSTRRGDPGAAEPSGEVLTAGDVAADRAGLPDLDRTDR